MARQQPLRPGESLRAGVELREHSLGAPLKCQRRRRRPDWTAPFVSTTEHL